MENEHLTLMQSIVGKSLDFIPSGLTRWLGGRLIDVALGGVVVEYVVRDDFLNPSGTLHGGIIATMLDDLVGMTMFTTGEEAFYSTINFAIDYFESAKLGEIVRAKSFLTKKGNRIANIELVLENQDKRPIAKAHTNLIKTKINVKEKIFGN